MFVGAKSHQPCPAPLPPPTAALRHFRCSYIKHRPLSASRQAWHFYSPSHQLLLHHRPPPRPGQAWRRATATPPQLHRATATPPRHRNSTAPPANTTSCTVTCVPTSCPSPTTQRRRRPPQELRSAAVPQPPQLLLLFCICPCLVPCFSCFQNC